MIATEFELGVIDSVPTLYVFFSPPVEYVAGVEPTKTLTSVAPYAKVSVTVPSVVDRKVCEVLVRKALMASSPD